MNRGVEIEIEIGLSCFGRWLVWSGGLGSRSSRSLWSSFALVVEGEG